MIGRLILPLLLLAAAPVAAQQAALPGAPSMRKDLGPGLVSKNAPVNGVLTLFGNERCPTDTDGNEIVVCVRRSASEQYRVPKELREFEVTPANQSWAAKAQAGLDAGSGVDSVGSCSAVGAGGSSGCEVAASRANKRYWDEKKAAAANVP